VTVPRKQSAAWPGRRSIALAIAALAAAVAVWWYSGSASQSAQVAQAGLPAATARVVAAGAPSSAARIAALPPPPVAPYPAGGPRGVATDDPLTAYRKANVYPPTSRPLTRDQLDLLRPNQRHETMRPVDRGGVMFLFTADRYFVIGDETLTATLEARRDGAPVPVTIVQAHAVVSDPATRSERAIPMSYAASGAGLASTLAPAKLGLARQSAISVFVEFDHGGGTQRAHFNFQYTPARGIPARFTGTFSDTIEAGSLVIRAGVEVATPGHYVIDCNLFDVADQPVAWSRFKGELAAGIHDAELLYFGKVIVDAGARGPFRIGQLRGARYAPGLDPDLEQMPPFTGAYATRSYALDEFSDAEWDSADKRRMIELLGANKNHRGAQGGDGSPQPGDSPEPTEPAR
jgi:hypothetical protein